MFTATPFTTAKTDKQPKCLSTLHIHHSFLNIHILYIGFPGGSEGKESACDVEEPSLIPRLGRSSGEGHGNPLQYSYLENSTDRGAWWATVHGIAKSDTTEQLTHTYIMDM